MTLRPANTAAILLAAGASSRFGGDKLSAPLRDGTVLSHSAANLAAVGCAYCAIVLQPDSRLEEQAASLGFSIILNPSARDGLSTSIRAGVDWAERSGAKGVMLVLADMPFVSPDHFDKLFNEASASATSCACTEANGIRMPPALFGASWFAQLKHLSGDSGAKTLLAAQPKSSCVTAAGVMLTDIDTPADLDKFRK